MNNSEENQKYNIISLFLSLKETIYSHTKNIHLFKGYKYTIKNNKIYITTFYRQPRFLFQNQYYDKEGILINEALHEKDKNDICNIHGNNNEFLEIYNLCNCLGKINLCFNGMRWDIYLLHKDRLITIKLPIEINDDTIQKIKYLTTYNIKDDISIIDLRFDNKIYLVS